VRGGKGAEGQRLAGATELAKILRCPLCSRCSGRQSIVDVEDDDTRTIGEAYGARLRFLVGSFASG